MTLRFETQTALWSGLCCALTLGTPAAAQVRFSINTPSSTTGQLTPSGLGPIGAADVLRPSAGDDMPALGPLASPEIALSGGGVAELDALSYGDDALITMANLPNCSVWFSVGPGSFGISGMPALAPTVSSENNTLGNDAVADIFVDRGLIGMLPAGPIGLGGPSRHVGMIDGDGLPSFSGVTTPGLGLIEPLVAGGGDDLDAFDAVHDGAFDDSQVYFSLDGPSAMMQGVSPADVLFGDPLVNTVYAQAMLLGLSPTMDDVDALAIWDDGDDVYEPADETFSWGPNADMLLFSVSRQSAVVGQFDSLQGLQIVPGDILIPPTSAGMRPGILIAAERLGLRTVRINAAANDELDALDLSFMPLFDCDASGVEDACEISAGLLPDDNKNGVPDDCDPTLEAYCVGTLHGGGCVASIGWTGTPTLTGADDFHVTASDVLNNVNGLMFFGQGSAMLALQGGVLCVQPPLKRTGIQFSGGDLLLVNCSGGFDRQLPQADLIALGFTAGDDIFCQYWFRDASQPFNVAFSTALQATLLP